MEKIEQLLECAKHRNIFGNIGNAAKVLVSTQSTRENVRQWKKARLTGDVFEVFGNIVVVGSASDHTSNIFLISRMWMLLFHIKLMFNICLCRFSWHVTQSKFSQKHANFRTFSSFSCISFELLSFLPSVSKTNVHKLSIPLHLKAIIKIFRSGFWDLWLAIQTCRRGVRATCKQWPWSLGL